MFVCVFVCFALVLRSFFVPAKLFCELYVKVFFFLSSFLLVYLYLLHNMSASYLIHFSIHLYSFAYYLRFPPVLMAVFFFILIFFSFEVTCRFEGIWSSYIVLFVYLFTGFICLFVFFPLRDESQKCFLDS